jgi:acetoin utilization protein AcuC
LSIHEGGRWPMRPRDWGGPGALDDRGAEAGAEGWARNLPVPEGFNDSELAFLVEAAVLPLIERFGPQALVVQCGADALEDDPQSRLSLSNGALWQALAAVLPTAPRRLVLGGGGYNPWSVGRAWAGVWATLNGFEVPERLPAEAEALLRALSWRHRRAKEPPERWFTTLADPARPGPLRDEVRAAAQAVLA